MLFDYKADVNLEDVNGYTGFMILCRNGNTNTIKMLIDRGIDINY